MRTLLVPRDHLLRGKVESLIRDVYATQYRAEIESFPPLLLAMCGRDGSPVCATGLRFSSDGFFSEIYLDDPIEAVLGALAGEQVNRAGIFEVSSLVTKAPALATRFLVQIVMFGERAGFDWAFFTATSQLQSLLTRLRLPMLELAAADRRRIAGQQAWGSYYETSPAVYAVSQRQLSAFFEAPHARVAHA
jgi:hypothetical protein